MAGGFRPVSDISGHPYTGKIDRYHVAASHATLLAEGDPVRATGTAHTDGVAEVDAANATDPIVGIIVGIPPNYSNLEQKGLPASTAGYVLVATDRELLLEAEISGGTVAVTNVGNNTDIVATAATQTGGYVNSNMTLDATKFTASSAQMRLVALKEAADGSLGTAAGSTVYCRINESFIDGTAGV